MKYLIVPILMISFSIHAQVFDGIKLGSLNGDDAIQVMYFHYTEKSLKEGKPLSLGERQVLKRRLKEYVDFTEITLRLGGSLPPYEDFSKDPDKYYNENLKKWNSKGVSITGIDPALIPLSDCKRDSDPNKISCPDGLYIKSQSTIESLSRENLKEEKTQKNNSKKTNGVSTQ